MRYQVTVKRVESYVQTVTVEANSARSAMDKADEMIESGEVKFRKLDPDYADEEAVCAECEVCMDHGTGACQGECC